MQLRSRHFTWLVFVTVALTTPLMAEAQTESTWYLYRDVPVPLEAIPGEFTVGPASGTTLAAGPLRVAALDADYRLAPLGDAVWRIEPATLAPVPPTEVRLGDPPRSVTPGAGGPKTGAKAGVPDTASAMAAIRDQLDAEWIYPAYRNPETGTRLWLTPRIIVAPASDIRAAEIEAKLPPTVRVVRPLRFGDLVLVELVDPGSGDPVAASRELAGLDWVAWAEPDFIQDWQRELVPNDPLFGDQWHLQNTGQGGGLVGADARLPTAWDVTTGSSTTVIAIIDDGVQTTHPDLPIFTNPGEIPGNGVDDDGNGYIDDLNGWDFGNDDNNPNPVTSLPSHGTAVAGVAGASGNNAVGVSGACQDCVLLPVRVSEDTGAFVSSAVLAEAIDYAGGLADVLNNSWGGGSFSAAIETAIQNASSSGRGGLGAPVLFANGNSASGYFRFNLTGFTAGTFTFTWTYQKDVSVAAGFDTVWLDSVTFPDGTVEEFEGCGSLPSGWTSSGNANWIAESDGARAASRRGGHCSIRAGAIGNSQTSSVSVTKTLGVGGDLSFSMWPSSETTGTGGVGPLTSSCYDYVSLTVSDGVTTYGPFFQRCGTYSNQGNPLQDGTIFFPSNVAEAISVGSATNFDTRSDYSQWGPEIDFVCHSNGGSLGITTTDLTGGNGYSGTDYTSSFGGTSSATPLCSGIAALALSQDPTLTAAEIRQLMRDSTRTIGYVPYVSGWNNRFGYGAVSAEAVMSGLAGSQIIVEKRTIPAGDATLFSFTGAAAGSISDGGQLTANVSAGAHAVTETVPSGWSLLRIECDDTDSVGTVGSATADYQVGSAETVTCIFTNCADSVGSTVDISGTTVTPGISPATYEACDTLEANTFTIQTSATANFHTGRAVVIGNGFQIQQGGELTVTVIGKE